MGYDLYITRKEFHASNEGVVITPDEWLAVIQNDPELTVNDLNHPYFAYWTGPGQYPCWLDYINGDLYSKNPTDEMVDKMVQIAKRLGARVQGDDGEEYLGGDQATEPDQNGQWFVYRLRRQD